MRERWEDLVKRLHEGVDSLRERLTEWRGSWPWWTKKRYIKKILEPVTPDFSKVKKRFLRRKQYFELRNHLKWTGSRHLCFKRLGTITGTWMEIIYLRVEKEITDIRPFMYELFIDGWEVTKSEDGRRRREYTLENEDWHTKLLVIASIGRDARCEVIEHEEEKVETVKTYEIICEGEKELRGID